jgi:hypothetical protein
MNRIQLRLRVLSIATAPSLGFSPVFRRAVNARSTSDTRRSATEESFCTRGISSATPSPKPASASGASAFLARCKQVHFNSLLAESNLDCPPENGGFFYFQILCTTVYVIRTFLETRNDDFKQIIANIKEILSSNGKSDLAA